MTSTATSADPSGKPSGGPTEGAGNQRFRFGKIEKLCSKRSFDILFEKRRVFYMGCLQVIYTVEHPADLAQFPLMVAFAAPKRQFKRAVDRNVVKRRMKEAYRLHKSEAVAVFREKGKNAAFLIKYNVREIRNFNEIAHDMQRALKRLTDFI